MRVTGIARSTKSGARLRSVRLFRVVDGYFVGVVELVGFLAAVFAGGAGFGGGGVAGLIAGAGGLT